MKWIFKNKFALAACTQRVANIQISVKSLSKHGKLAVLQLHIKPDGPITARNFYGKRFSVHQLRPKDQTGTQVLTGFHNREALKTEVVGCSSLSDCAGIPRESEWDASKRSGSSGNSARTPHIRTVRQSPENVENRQATERPMDARGNGVEACFRDI